MARAINQTIAWGLATVMATVVFAGGYGVFKLMAPKDGAHGGSHESSHSDAGHKQSGHGDDHAPASDHEPTAPASEKAHGDGHGDSHGGSHGNTHGDSHNAADAKSHEVKTHGKKEAAHGEEEEISADQFKKDEHH